ncbi:hypothetical protein GUITHDRAFT_61647, partial [Guillardia theta CCMP2712]
GVVRVIVEAMGLHPGDQHVQEEGCSFMKSLAEDGEDGSELGIMIASLGGIEAIVRAIKLHPGSWGCFFNGCWALAGIARNDDIGAKIAANGGIQAILEAMEMHP